MLIFLRQATIKQLPITLTRPYIPSRLGERHQEHFISHVLGIGSKRPICTPGRRQLEFDLLLESQSKRHSFISLVGLDSLAKSQIAFPDAYFLS